MAELASTWSIRYEMNQIPWDLGRAHPELTGRLVADPSLGLGKLGTVLVPGCGAGQDAGAFADHGWKVIALDFAKGARRLVEQKLAGRGTFVLADLFTYEPDVVVDLIFDHTCFCAIPPSRRPEFGPAMARILAPGGRFVSVVFPVDKPLEHGGPPHTMSTDDLVLALGDDFELAIDEDIDCAGRRWPNRWAEFKRR